MHKKIKQRDNRNCTNKILGGFKNGKSKQKQKQELKSKQKCKFIEFIKLIKIIKFEHIKKQLLILQSEAPKGASFCLNCN